MLIFSFGDVWWLDSGGAAYLVTVLGSRTKEIMTDKIS